MRRLWSKPRPNGDLIVSLLLLGSILMDGFAYAMILFMIVSVQASHLDAA